MARNNGKCVVCGNAEIAVPSCDTCKNCYSAVLRWSKRNSKDVSKRANQLGLYAKRMMIITNKSDEKALTPNKITLKAMPGRIKLKEFSRIKSKYKKPR